MAENPQKYIQEYLREKDDCKQILKEEGFLLAKRKDVFEDEDYLEVMFDNYKPILEREIDNYLEKINPNIFK